ncbi:MAG: hypothetical protein K6T65_04335 [Peptococcaceae bacterium]|nr:hypothetical protein [Peptococcaceae bacterium]
MEQHGREEVLLRDLLDLYRRKNGLLAEMREATTARCSLDEADQAGEILKLFEARQGLMERIDVLDTEIKELNRRLQQLTEEEGRPGASPGDLAGVWEKVREQQEAGRQIVREMQELDRQQEPRLEMQYARIKELRKKTRACRNTINAYRKSPDLTESVFIDKRK